MTTEQKVQDNEPENPTEEEFQRNLERAGMSEEQRKLADMLRAEENSGGSDASAEDIEALEADMQGKLQEMQNQLLRTMADMENLRSRTKRDIEEAHKYGTTNLARDLIGVLENLRRAEDSIPQEEVEKNELFKNISEGVKMVSSELLRVFEQHGIKRIDPQGEKFDHHYHQAMVEIPTDEAEPGTVVQVMQAGYIIHDRLLRPAMVGVAKAATQPAAQAEQPQAAAEDDAATDANAADSDGDANSAA